MSIEDAFQSLRWQLAKDFATETRGTWHGGISKEDFAAADHAINAMSNVDLLAELARHEKENPND